MARFAFLLVASLLALLSAGCAQRDSATVTIEYQRSNRARELSLEPSDKQRLIAAFTRVTKERGYKCRAHVKRVEEVTCVGPKEMNVTFKPELNRTVYIVRFNWVELDDRTRTEFDGHVASFVQGMRDAVAGTDVRVSVARH